MNEAGDADAPAAAPRPPCATRCAAAWLEGMPKVYLVQQLTRFASGERHNDGLAQMRNMARALKREEIESLADFYARHGEGEAR